MEFLTLINSTGPFLLKGLLGSIFHFYSNSNRTFCEQTVETLITIQMRHSAASDLGLHCLPMSHKKGARLIWVNTQVRFHICDICSGSTCFLERIYTGILASRCFAIRHRDLLQKRT